MSSTVNSNIAPVPVSDNAPMLDCALYPRPPLTTLTSVITPSVISSVKLAGSSAPLVSTNLFSES
jgi:hypothetical protein